MPYPFTIVIPTYNEAGGIERLLRALDAAFKEHGLDGEIIVVDDNSPDGTGAIVDRLVGRTPGPLLASPRQARSCPAVLSTAGRPHARSRVRSERWMPISATTSKRSRRWSKRSHRAGTGSPSAAATCRAAASPTGRSAAILTSRVACMLARPLTGVKDVTSGYFLVKREAIEGVELDPIGFKIGLEVIAKGHYGKAIEIPYVFTDRIVGESKLNEKEIFNYLKQLRKLYMARLLPAGQKVVLPTPEWLRIRRGKDAEARDAALWSKCPICGEVLYRRDLAANSYVCTKCGHHFRMGAYDRITTLVDGDFTEVGADILPRDPLGWADKKSYPVKLNGDREKSGLSEAVVCGFGRSADSRVALGVMDFNFRGGTMGTRRRRAYHAAARGSA